MYRENLFIHSSLTLITYSETVSSSLIIIVKRTYKSAGMANRPARVEFAITNSQMRNYYPDGKTEEVMWKAGEVKWSELAT